MDRNQQEESFSLEDLRNELKVHIGKAVGIWAMKDVLGEIQENLVTTLYDIIDADFAHR